MEMSEIQESIFKLGEDERVSLKKLVEKDPSRVNDIIDMQPIGKCTVFFALCWFQRHKNLNRKLMSPTAVKYYIETHNADINYLSKTHGTPFNILCRSRYMTKELLEYLLKQGGNLNISYGINKITPFFTLFGYHSLIDVNIYTSICKKYGLSLDVDYFYYYIESYFFEMHPENNIKTTFDFMSLLLDTGRELLHKIKKVNFFEFSRKYDYGWNDPQKIVPVYYYFSLKFDYDNKIYSDSTNKNNFYYESGGFENMRYECVKIRKFKNMFIRKHYPKNKKYLQQIEKYIELNLNVIFNKKINYLV
jgi:hypothetical protein